MNGASATKLKSMWHVVNSKGKENPYIPSTYLFARLRVEFRDRYTVIRMAYCAPA